MILFDRDGLPNLPLGDDNYQTAFFTRYGSYEYTVMSFRLTNAPTYFMYLMNSIFFEELDVFMIIFVAGSKLWQALLFVVVSKCVFLVARVDSRAQESHRRRNGLSWFGLLGPYIQQLMILILKSTQNLGVIIECKGERVIW
jgi:hypothetical protein